MVNKVYLHKLSDIPHLLSLLLSTDCKRSTILKLKKDDIISNWDKAIDALKESIDYLKNYGVVVSRLLPYDALLVPFAYFFSRVKKNDTTENQRLHLQQFFWRMALSHRYSSALESKLTQDVQMIIKKIIDGESPSDDKIDIDLNNLNISPENLINTWFTTGSSYCKAIICLLAKQNPKNFNDNTSVALDNDWLKQSNSKNYHHFYPKAHLKNIGEENYNNVVNITIVGEGINKGKISNKPPSQYLQEFKKNNIDNIETTLISQFIEWEDVIKNDAEMSYEYFLDRRALRMSLELKKLVGLKVNDS